MAKMDKIKFLSGIEAPGAVIAGDLVVKGTTITENSIDKTIDGAITVVNNGGTLSEVTLMGQVILTGYRVVRVDQFSNTLKMLDEHYIMGESTGFNISCFLEYGDGNGGFIDIKNIRFEYDDLNVIIRLYGTFSHDNIERLLYDDTLGGWLTVDIPTSDGQVISKSYQTTDYLSEVYVYSDEVFKWFSENASCDSKLGNQAYGILYDPVSESIRLGIGTYNYNAEQDTHEFEFSNGEGKPIAVRELRAEDDGSLVMWDAEKYCLVKSPIKYKDAKTTLVSDTHIVGEVTVDSLQTEELLFTIDDNGVSTINPVTARSFITETSDDHYTLVLDNNNIAYDIDGSVTVDISHTGNATFEETVKAKNIVATNSIVINEGTASGISSIAGGSTDKEMIEGLLGGLTSSMVQLHPSEAKGALSIALGADNVTNTGGSVAMGYDNISGGKGYYFDDIDFTNRIITLSSTRRTSTLVKPTYPSSVNWAAGDKLFIVNDGRYWLEVESVSGNKVTVKKLPFSAIEYKSTLTVFTYSKPNDRSVINVNKPEDGVVDIGWGAIGIGTQNTVVGSNAYAVGYKNIVAGDFGVAFGNENIVGYCASATGANNQALGRDSVAVGDTTVASGSCSNAEGYKTEATEYTAHAEGNDTHATNVATHAEGYKTYATGRQAHAEGNNTTASGEDSHAEGNATRAEGQKSHAEGRYTTAQGEGSHAEGDQTLATGIGAHAEGGYIKESRSDATHVKTTAEGYGSHAEGGRTYAKAQFSHAEGIGTEALSPNSHAEGRLTRASNYHAHAEGNWTTASGEASHAEGTETHAYGKGSHAEGIKVTAYANGSHAEGESTKNAINYIIKEDGSVVSDSDVIASWESNKFSVAKAKASHVEGRDTLALGNYSHAEGIETKAVSEASHAEGRLSKAEGVYAHAEGNCTAASGESAHAEGNETKAIGKGAHAEGDHTVASGQRSHAGGYYSQANHVGSFAHGSHLHTSREYQAVFGSHNADNSQALLIVGSGSGDDSRTNALEVTDNSIKIGMIEEEYYETQNGVLQYVTAESKTSQINFDSVPDTSIISRFYRDLHYGSKDPMDEQSIMLQNLNASIELSASRRPAHGEDYFTYCYLRARSIVLDCNSARISGVIELGSTVLTEEKLAKIIKFIDSIEEVTE